MSIRSKLLAPLALLVAFLLLSLGATLALTRAQGDDALKVNLAGRQRMLSQKLARDLLLADRLQDPALLDQARRTLRVFDETLTALQEGGTAPAGLSTEERVTLSAPGSEAAEAIRAFRPQWEPFRGAVLARLEGRGELDPQTLAAATAGTLKAMNDLTERLQAEAEGKVRLLRLSQSLFALLGVLLLLGAWVFYGRTVVASVGALRGATEDLARGGGYLNRRIPEVSRDELGRAAGSFNRFLENLRGSLTEATGAFRDGAFQASHVDRELRAFGVSFEAMEGALREGQEGIERITGSMEEQTAGIEELSATGQTLARMAEDLNRTAGAIAEQAEEGRGSLEGVGESLGALHARMDEMGALAQDLSGKASGIHQVVRVITEIADQTNLLALNAAIEAARAGEAGRGFAVVAEEVRKLAEESNSAARSIGDLARGIVAGTGTAVQTAGSGVALAESAERETGLMRQRIAEVLGAISQIVDQIQSVAATSQQQSAGAQEMAASVERLSRGTQSARDLSEEILRVVSELADSSRLLADASGQLDRFTASFQEMMRRYRLEGEGSPRALRS